MNPQNVELKFTSRFVRPARYHRIDIGKTQIFHIKPQFIKPQVYLLFHYLQPWLTFLVHAVEYEQNTHPTAEHQMRSTSIQEIHLDLSSKREVINAKKAMDLKREF